MPIYEYKCGNGHAFEAVQRMSDDPITKCEVCAAPVERVFHPVAVHFKGSGFYTTDYGSKKKPEPGSGDSDGKAKSSSESKGSDSASPGSDSGTGDSGKTDSGKSDSGAKAGAGSD